MSHAGDNFGTPRNVCELLYKFWGGEPDLDPCTGPNAIFRAKTMWSVGGLQREWLGGKTGRKTAYVNMPYSRLLPWMRKCAVEAPSEFSWRSRREIIALPPASTSAGWWKEYATTADAFAFTKRLSFIGESGDGSARFHSVLIYWGERVERFKKVMESITTMFCKTA